MASVLLQWETWVYGLVAALIGGGSGAIATGFAQVIVDPQHADLRHMLALMGTSFVVAGILSAAAYLAKSPLPQIVTTTATEKVITPLADGGAKISSVATTTTEPANLSKEKP